MQIFSYLIFAFEMLFYRLSALSGRRVKVVRETKLRTGVCTFISFSFEPERSQFLGFDSSTAPPILCYGFYLQVGSSLTMVGVHVEKSLW